MHYNAKLTGGCVLCRREKGDTRVKPGGKSKKTLRASGIAPVAAIAVGVAVAVSGNWKTEPTPASQKFSMKAPPGWKAVNPRAAAGAAKDAAAGFPPEHRAVVERLAREIRGRKVVALWANLGKEALSADGFVETINVTEIKSAPYVDEDFLAEARRELPKMQDQAIPGVQFRLLDAMIVDLAESPALRILAEGAIAGRRVKFLQHIVPAGDKAFIVTATTLPDDFDALIPLFDGAAATIRGAKQGVKRGFDIKRAAMVGGIAGGASAATMLLLSLARRRKRDEG